MRKTQTNAADEGQVRRARKDAARQESRDKDEIIDVLETESGRKVLWSILEECSVFKTCYTTNTLTTFHLEGTRDVGLRLMDRIQSAGLQFMPLMWKEAAARKAKLEDNQKDGE